MTRPRTVASELLDVLLLTTRAFRRQLRRVRPPIEITQWALLKRIAEGPSTMSALARHNATSLPTISKSVGMLVRRGWVERSADLSDRRQMRVRLTAGGRRLLGTIRGNSEEVIAGRVAALTQEERNRLMSSLTRLTEVLAEEE